MPVYVGQTVQYFTRNHRKQWGNGEGPYAAVVICVHESGSADLYVLPTSYSMMPRIETDVFENSPVPGDKAEHWYDPGPYRRP